MRARIFARTQRRLAYFRPAFKRARARPHASRSANRRRNSCEIARARRACTRRPFCRGACKRARALARLIVYLRSACRRISACERAQCLSMARVLRERQRRPENVAALRERAPRLLAKSLLTRQPPPPSNVGRAPLPRPPLDLRNLRRRHLDRRSIRSADFCLFSALYSVQSRGRRVEPPYRKKC